MNLLVSSSTAALQVLVGSDLVDLAARVNAFLTNLGATYYIANISLSGSGHGNEFAVTISATQEAGIVATKDENATQQFAFKASESAIYLDGGSSETALSEAGARVRAWMAQGTSGQFVAMEVAGSSKGYEFAIMGFRGTRTTITK